MHSGADTRIPHHLRLIIFFLRLALGLDFFYLGWSALFNAALMPELKQQSFGQLYHWVSASPAATFAWLHPYAAWLFLVIGACLILGLITTLAAIAGLALTILAYFPSISIANITLLQFINDGVVVVLCLLILIFSRAGKYLGVDSLLRLRKNK